MTAPHIVNPAALLEQGLSDASPDLMRTLLGTVLNALLSADADAVCGAEYGRPSRDRTNSRNGYRHRELDTRVGTVDVAIPKLRQGSYFPEWLLERRKRAEAALISVVATCYLLGVSTRRMDKLVATLGVTSLSRSQVSRMSADLDEQVEAFHTRPLGEAGPFTFVAADALTMKVREDGRVVNAVVLVPDHRRTRSAFGMCLPVQIVEQVRWPHLDQTYTPPGEEPQEVEHVIRVRAPRRPGEVSALQVRQKSINHRDVVAPPGGDITGKKEHISVAGYPKHHRHLQSAKPPTSSVSTDKPRRWDLTCAERVALARAG